MRKGHRALPRRASRTQYAASTNHRGPHTAANRAVSNQLRHYRHKAPLDAQNAARRLSALPEAYRELARLAALRRAAMDGQPHPHGRTRDAQIHDFWGHVSQPRNSHTRADRHTPCRHVCQGVRSPGTVTALELQRASDPHTRLSKKGKMRPHNSSNRFEFWAPGPQPNFPTLVR